MLYKRKISYRSLAGLGLSLVGAIASAHWIDATIIIKKVINSPTLSVKYSGSVAAIAELIVNGESFGTRPLNATSTSGETTFDVSPSLLRDGDNDVEVRLLDKAGHVVGVKKTTIQAEDPEKPAVFLTGLKMGSSVEGPVEIKVGFAKELKDIYVSFFVDNQVRTFINQPPYSYMWDTMRERNGWHEVEAWVADDAGTTYKTKKVKLFVQNAGGRTDRRVISNVIGAQPSLAGAAAAVKAAPTISITAVNATKATKKTNKKAVAAKAVKAPKVTKKAVVAAAVNKISIKQIDMVPSIGEAVFAAIEAQLSLKSPAMVESVMMSERLMTPTGTRNAVAQQMATAAGRPSVIASASAIKPTMVTAPAKVTMPEIEVKAQPAKITTPSTVAVVAKPVELKVAENTSVAGLSGSTLLNHATALPSGAGVETKATAMAPTATTVIAAPIKIEQPSVVKAVAVPVRTLTVKPNTVATTPKVVTALIKIAKGTRIPRTGSFAVIIDGTMIDFDVQPRFTNGIPVSPIRHILEKEGGKVSWSGKDKTVHAEIAKKDIMLQIGAAIAQVDGNKLKMELPATLESGRTLVPLSFLRDALGIDVQFDKATGHVLLSSVKN